MYINIEYMKVPFNTRAKRPLLYLITISNLKKNIYVSSDELSMPLSDICKSCILLEGSKEIGPVYKQLHFHGIVVCPYLMWTHRFYIHNNWKVSFKEIYDYNNAVNYVYKNQFQCHEEINALQEKSVF